MMYACNDLYAAIQGEGCLSGTPMALVRLHGCPVGCPFCDTKETWHADPANRRDVPSDALGTNPLWFEAEAPDIARLARRLGGPAVRWALVTGGEPALRDLNPLVDALHAEGFKAAVETSGTALGHVGAGFDWVCVSPKIGMPGGLVVLPEALALADEIKYVVGKTADLETLAGLLASSPLKAGVEVCLQPLSLNPKATELCTRTAMERGWRLSLQTHRLLGLR